ncbi:MAG: hypothetical protein J6S85_18605 [Methanobrevibacter sp.]|nr:hypothetical protein [Methanobrevibacter sp.]
MKAILMSIRPEHVANILNKIKTLEIRKRFPSDYVGWVYIYATKGNKEERLIADLQPDKVYHPLTEALHRGVYSIVDEDLIWNDCKKNILNGKVVARFWCDKVEEIKWHKDTAIDLDYYKVVNVIENEEILKASCLQLKELENYLQIKNAKNIPLDWGITFNLGKAIHITELEIFDKPKEISEFIPYCELCGSTSCCNCKHAQRDSELKFICCDKIKSLTRAPQSWQFIEV